MPDPSSKLRLFIDRLGSPTHLLVASVRRLPDLATLARQGVNTFTLLPHLLHELLNNPLTSKAAAEFEEKAMAGKLDHCFNSFDRPCAAAACAGGEQ